LKLTGYGPQKKDVYYLHTTYVIQYSFAFRSRISVFRKSLKILKLFIFLKICWILKSDGAMLTVDSWSGCKINRIACIICIKQEAKVL